MEKYFWVKWKDSKKCEHVVGLLCYSNNKYFFKYNPDYRNEENIPSGFNGVPSFGRIVNLEEEQKEKIFAMRSSDELFPFFKMRIVKENEKEIWQSYGLEEYDECKLMALTKGKMPTDSFFVEEMDNEAVNDIKGLYVKDEEMSIER